MVLIEENSFYSIRREYTLSPMDRDVLVRLYGPIVGPLALNIYFVLDTLVQAADCFEDGLNLTLVKLLGMSFGQFDEGRRRLEACNLIETYRCEEKNSVTYIYKILPPATPKKFLSKNNIVLRGLLIKNMGSKYLTLMKNHFAIDSKIASSFDLVNASINTVFDFDMNESKCFFIDDDDPNVYPDKKYKRVEDNFSLEEFKNLLAVEQISLSVVATELDEIRRIVTIYALPMNKCIALIKESIGSDNTFSLDRFKNRAMDTVKYGVNEEFHHQNLLNGDTINAYTVQKYESMSPTEYLFNVTQAAPIKAELMLIDKISSQFGFTSGVINFILDYTLGKCENKLPENFVLKVCATLKRNHVTTGYEAMNALYRSEYKALNAKKSKDEPDYETTRDDSEKETTVITTDEDINVLIGDEL